jgi:UDP-N-acetylglucosamine--dolichyl-phosphate N-acetylglucosaminephosphotransferase
MTGITIALSVAVALFATLYVTPWFMKYFRAIRLVGLDLHKKKTPILPTSIGIPVTVGILTGLFFFIALETFVVKSLAQENLEDLLAVISSVMIIAFVGFFDDLNVSRRKLLSNKNGERDIRIGLPQWLKPLLTLPAAIPLMAVNAGVSTLTIPFFGSFNFGILYPLLLVPIGIVGSANMVNMLGGFNGVEIGMGIVYTLALGIYALQIGNFAAIIFLITFAALLGAWKFNLFPAKILPGDSLTYLLGAIVAAGVITGNMEKIGIIVMFPFIIEGILKAISKFEASCLGKLRPDGKLDAPYGKKIYSLTHLVMNLGKFSEKQMTAILILIQTIFAIIPFLNII